MRLVNKESGVIVRVSDDYAASLLAGGHFSEVPTAGDSVGDEIPNKDAAPLRKRRTGRSS